MSLFFRGIIALLALIVLAIGGGLAWFLSGSPPDPPAYVERRPAPVGQPNILLLVAEDLSPRIGAFGDPVAHTPNLDALAEEGVRYPNVFTTAGVCAPSRAALITGMHQISFGAQHMRTSSRPDGGYKTVPPAHVKAFPEQLRATGYYTYTDNKLDYQFSGVWGNTGPFTIWDDEGDGAHWRNRGDGQPFFALDNLLVTHESGLFPKLGAWPRSTLHFAIQLLQVRNYGHYDVPEVSPDDIPLPPYYPDTQAVRDSLAQHYRNIAVMDHQVGEALALLEQDGLADNTIVIWTTDHGDGLPRAKRELFDSGIKVPMIVRWPESLRPENALPGSTDERLISFVDLAPTILAMAGVESPEHLHGRSFLAASQREKIFAARDRIDSVPDRQRAVRTAQFKYIRSWVPDQPGGHDLGFRNHLPIMRDMKDLFARGELDDVQARWFLPPGTEQLYDVTSDPHETRNLIDSPGHQQVLNGLQEELDNWLARAGDTSNQSEQEMVAGFLDENGQPRKTPVPSVSVNGNQIILSSEVDGASIGYQLDEGPWHLYAAPFETAGAAKITAKAVRYGWDESDLAEHLF